jgi:surfactin synthase thioesterase subunit
MSQYFVSVTKRKEARVRLIFCPHAGGSSLGYLRLQDACPLDVDLFILDLPGRNQFFEESWPRPWQDIIRVLSPEVIKDPRPTIFLGHSFGALIALELAHVFSLQKRPLVLGLSGLNAPTKNRLKSRRKISRLPDVEFAQEIGKFHEGNLVLPPAFLHIIKSDLKMLDDYSPTPKNRMPSLVFGGSEDQLTSLNGLSDWGELVDLKSPPKIYAGTHFSYILESIQPIIEQLYQLLGSENCHGSFG